MSQAKAEGRRSRGGREPRGKTGAKNGTQPGAAKARRAREQLRTWFRENASATEALIDEVRGLRPDWTAGELEVVGQAFFLALAVRSGDATTWVTTQRLALQREKLAFEREKFQQQSRTKLALGLDAVAQAFIQHPAALALFRQARALVGEGALEPVCGNGQLAGGARPGWLASDARASSAPAALTAPADGVAQRLANRQAVRDAPVDRTFHEFLSRHAQVLGRDGAGSPFSLAGRAPLALVIEWLDKILRNTLDHEAVEIDGVPFEPGGLKGATLAVAGGAQFGKTVLELNLMAYATAVRFLSAGNYLPDRLKVEEIVDQKFRPNVLDLYPWMAAMIQLGKVRNASGKTINRKQSYTVTNGERKAFGSFCGMHKPPTSITLDLALLDEVDDIQERNIGYVDARMTNSPVHLTAFIGTQRLADAGQNARLQASSFHVKLVPCPACHAEWCLEEEFPRCIRLRRPTPRPTPHLTATPVACDPILAPELGYDRSARYYVACPECGTELDRDTGRYVAKHPERVAQARLGVRVSQLNISAISIAEIVGAWYAAFEDPSGNAMAAFCCDRIAIPNAGAAQPITQGVLDDCRALGLAETPDYPAPYSMSLAHPEPPRPPLSQPPCPRVAGMDLGPRCWFWCDEIRSPQVSACVWAELMASGQAATRLPLLMEALSVRCVLLDAGGEPDLTKRLVLALNGLDHYAPPAVPRAELVKWQLYDVGLGLSWDGDRGEWRGLRAAAVLFVAGAARGLEQTIGFTQEGLIYPLLKCQRSETIQTAVNDFLTPKQGVLELLPLPGSPPGSIPDGGKRPRELPRARLPQTCAGPGVSRAVLDSHLLNLRKERHPRSGLEDWIEGVENHLGLAKAYARLAQRLMETDGRPAYGAVTSPDLIRSGGNAGPHLPPRRR